ncbi:MAG: NUDIX hydrolase [Saprospiraceae bacterium]
MHTQTGDFQKDSFINELQARLLRPLPGREAQYKMASLRRLVELENYAVPSNPKIACVLNLLHWQGGEWRTVLIERTTNPNDRHSGQISFPGGKYEEGDGALENVALREAEEEIGVPRSRVRILGRLTELYIPASNFLVHPFIGLLESEASFRLQAGEVEGVLTPALSVFSQGFVKKQADLTLSNGLTLKDVPYFDVEGRMVWGATAMILSEFLEILR